MVRQAVVPRRSVKGVVENTLFSVQDARILSD
jgi:hypothetical protein